VFRGHTISAGVGVFEGPDGFTFERDLVHHPGAVSVVPVVEEGTAVLLVRQFRAAVGSELLEVPAGTRDVEGESPERTAHRELAEEVGMRAGRMEYLCEFRNSPGFSDEHSWIYVAYDLEPCDTSPQGVEEQHMTVERVFLDDVPAMVADGRIADAKTIIGLMLTRERLS
jgi:ADP-ribose pyrophosphatase